MNRMAGLLSLFRDLRYAWRALRRSPAFTLMAVLTLGLGIGANTAIFTVIDGVLLRPLPYAKPAEIVHVEQTASRNGPEPIGFSVQEINDYREQSRAFSAMAEYHSMTFTMLGGRAPERVTTGVVSADFFDVLEVKPFIGRFITPADENRVSTPVLVLSYDYWKKEFGGDRSVLGKSVTLNDRVHTVIGVMRQVPQYPDANDVYMPTTSCPFRMGPQMIANRDARMLTMMARLKPGVTIATARRDLSTISSRLALAFPKSYPPKAGIAVKITPIDEELTHAARTTFLMLLGAAGLVLLLACANLANFALSRQLRRSREVAIHLASGASPWKVFRQLLTESILISLAGGIVGLAIAASGVKLLVAFAGRMTPLSGQIELDGRVLLFVIGISLLTGILFGTLPGYVASRTQLGILAGAGSRSTGTPAGARTRSSLIAIQVVFSFVLLVGAGLMMRSLYNLLSVDPGFKTANVLSMRVSLNWTKYSDQIVQSAFFHQILSRTAELPGVESVALSSMVPLNSESSGVSGGVLIDDRHVDPGEPAPRVDYELASPDYFHLLGIPLMGGRTFTEEDSREAPRVAIVNERFAKHYWPHEGAIGHHLSHGNGKTWVTVIGVVGNFHQYGLDKTFEDQVYLPQAQTLFMGDAHLLLRTRSNPTWMTSQIVAVIHGIDSQQPITDIRTLEQLRDTQLGTPRVTAVLLGLFATVALFITTVGISGALALSVAQRTKEIGVRMALGATKGVILRNILFRAMMPVLLGVAVGVALAAISTGLLASLLFGIQRNDPSTYMSIGLLLCSSALIGSVIPARRAVKIDPVHALRTE